MTPFIEEAGAIALRTHQRSLEVLLILSRKTPRIRIFPKGHIEPGESAAEAAGRELQEEAGVTGKLIGKAGTVSYEFKEKRYRVSYYVFRFERRIHDGEEGRDPHWYLPEEAYALLQVDEIRQLLKKIFEKDDFIPNEGGLAL